MCHTRPRRCVDMTPISDATPDLLAKVRKLLATAERTTNPNEADAFSRKAATLIAAHRIDPERLHGEQHDGLAVEELVLGRGPYVRGRLNLLVAVAESMGCQVVFQARDTGTVAMVAGFRDDLQSVVLLYHSLHTQVAGRMANQRRSTGAATQRWRRSFLMGYAEQIDGMLSATAAQARSRAHPSRATLPALRARDRQVAEFARQQFGRVRAARAPRPAHASGFHAGQRAARRADLGKPRVSPLRGLGRGA